jgi:hypothetical protein
MKQKNASQLFLKRKVVSDYNDHSISKIDDSGFDQRKIIVNKMQLVLIFLMVR